MFTWRYGRFDHFYTDLASYEVEIGGQTVCPGFRVHSRLQDTVPVAVCNLFMFSLKSSLVDKISNNMVDYLATAAIIHFKGF